MADLTSKYLCSITHELMTDPVKDSEGNNYERVAIEKWLEKQSISPVTKNPLTLNDLHSNDELRASIEEYRTKSIDSSEKVNPSMDVREESSELKLTSRWLNEYVHLSIEPSEGNGTRVSCDICCVVDVSGSMSTNVTIQSANGIENSRLNRLDIAKHALKTIIHSLQENDRLSIISFESKPSIILPLTSMNDEGRTNALTQLDKLRPNGGTNLWGGLKAGLDLLIEQQRTNGSNSALFLLTDGAPADSPPNGHAAVLAQYKAQTNFTCSVNTFGFGYELKSELLENLSQIGNSGSYAFIPDGSFVGTVFVNAISNLLTTAATNVKLSIGGIQPAVDSTSTYVCHYANEPSNYQFSNEVGFCVNLGSITFGQSKDLVLPMNRENSEKLSLILDYESAFGGKKKQCRTIVKLDGDEKLLNHHKFRLEFVDAIRKGYQVLRQNNFDANQPKVVADLQALEERIKAHSTDDAFLTDLLTDLTGQVNQAFSRTEWFNKWGKHYLPSLTRAHLFQQCNNFKDPGVQHYGQGDLFNSIRDDMDSIFCGLPASIPASVNTGYDTSIPAPIDMSVFNDSSGPCFHGSCTVKLFDGSIKFVKDIQRGDRLYPHGGTVKYILKTIRTNPSAPMVLLDTGLIITPWHPIRLNGLQWIFPCSLVPSPTDVLCDAVYSFALDQGHTVWVNDVECVTLGHGFQDDTVRHRYYGTERVIEDLRVLDGQGQCTGLVEIQSKWIMRNKRTGLVHAIRQPDNNNLISTQ